MVDYWTKEQDNLLRKHVNAPRETLEKMFKRSWCAISKRAFRLHLKREGEAKKWHDVEMAKLIEMYGIGYPVATIARELHRSIMAVKAKANLLGLKNTKQKKQIQKGGRTNIDKMVKGDIVRFGIASDRHLGSKYAQITYLHKFYALCEREGVDFMIDPGDTTDGNGTHYPGQLYEMHITGADNLKNFVIQQYPKFKNRLGNQGITYGIAGYHDLDLWVKQGYDLLKRIDQEREDYKCLGHASAELVFRDKKIQIQHPSGGTAYAVSYRTQKVVESFSSENKPHILIIGHYHKADFLPALRNVYCFQAGCFQAQTPFGVRKNITFMYGGWIVEFGVSAEGGRSSDKSITHMKAEFIPFYKPIIDDWKNYL